MSQPRHILTTTGTTHPHNTPDESHIVGVEINNYFQNIPILPDVIVGIEGNSYLHHILHLMISSGWGAIIICRIYLMTIFI